MNKRKMQDESSGIGGCLLFLLIGVCSLAWYWWWTAEASFEGTITRIHWVYAWDIEELRQVERECSTYNCYPEHSYNHRTDTDCRTVNDTRRCDTDYRYTINEWVVVGTQHATGEGNRERPYYPELILVREYGSADCPEYLEAYSSTSPVLGCQRAGQQHPHHYIVIETVGLERNFADACDIGFGRWSELNAGDSVSGMYFSNRNRLDCSSVEYN